MEELVDRIHELEEEENKEINGIVVSPGFYKELKESESEGSEETSIDDGFYGYNVEMSQILDRDDVDFYVAYETSYGSRVPTIEQVEDFAEDVEVKSFFDSEFDEHRYYVDVWLPLELSGETVIYTDEDDVHEDENVHPHREKGVKQYDEESKARFETVQLKLAATLDDEVVSNPEQVEANTSLGFEPEKETKAQLRKMVRNEVLRGVLEGEFAKPVTADRVYPSDHENDSEEFRIGKRILEFERLMLSDGFELPESVATRE